MIQIKERVQPVIGYHGTTDRFLREILKKGMVPDPDKRAWDEDPQANVLQISRASLYGSYWTVNVGIATSSSFNTVKKFGGKEIIVIANLIPESGVADEDKITFVLIDRIGQVISQNMLIGDLRDPMNLGMLWGMIKANYDILDPIIEQVARKIHLKFSKSSELKPIPYDMISKAVLSYLKRQALYAVDGSKQSYIFDWKSGFSRGHSDIEFNDIRLPRELFGMDKKEAENQFKIAQDQLTQYYREIAQKAMRQTPRGTMRMLEPVTYSGRNRIFCIVRLHPVQVQSKFSNNMVSSNAIEIVYGKPPQKFLDDWEKDIGDILWYEDYR